MEGSHPGPTAALPWALAGMLTEPQEPKKVEMSDLWTPLPVKPESLMRSWELTQA